MNNRSGALTRGSLDHTTGVITDSARRFRLALGDISNGCQYLSPRRVADCAESQ